MPTQPRDTWRDWFDDADQVEQVTRDQLIDLIAPRLRPGETVNTATLRHWEGIGVTPQPVRRWHEGATRALYPRPYAALAIFTILAMQSEGYSLAQIAARIRGRLKANYVDYDVLDKWKSHALGMASEFADATGIVSQRVDIVFVDSDGTEHVHGFEIKE